MTTHPPTTGPQPTAGAPAEPVIDLREAPTTRVRVSRTENPFATMAPPERMRLIIRVLCELVAYDDVDEDDGRAGPRRETLQAAMDASGGPARFPTAADHHDPAAAPAEDPPAWR